MKRNRTAMRVTIVALAAVVALSLFWSASLAAGKPSTPSTTSSDLGPGFVHQAAPLSSEYLELSFPAQTRLTYSSHVDHSVPGGFYGVQPYPTPGYNDGLFTAYTGEGNTNPGNLADCQVATDGRTFCYDGHAGLDIPQHDDSPVYAAMSGQVVAMYNLCPRDTDCGRNPYPPFNYYHPYGNFIALRSIDNNGYYNLYGHNTTVTLTVGSYVARGQLIAYSGNTGDSTGAHVHYGLERTDYSENTLTVLDPYGWFSYDTDPYNTGTDDILRLAGGYAPPAGSLTDPENWNQGTVIGNVRLDKDRNIVYAHYQIGDKPTSIYTADPIEAWWANHYGAAGAPNSAPYDGAYGRCQDFEGGTYCAGNNSYQNAIVNNVQLSDVPLEPTGTQSYWAHRYIIWAFREKIINGYTDCTGNNPMECPFRPDNSVLRGQLAIILTRAGVPLIQNHAQDFCDVMPGDWDYDAVETMANTDAGGGLHIMDGTGVACGNNMFYFNPNGNVRRDETAKSIIRYGRFRKTNGVSWIQGNVTTGYPDYIDISNSYLKDFIESLYNYGIIQHRQDNEGGIPGVQANFWPGLPATRAQIAMFLHELVFNAHSPDNG